VKSTNYEAPHRVCFSSLSLPLSQYYYIRHVCLSVRRKHHRTTRPISKQLSMAGLHNTWSSKFGFGLISIISEISRICSMNGSNEMHTECPAGLCQYFGILFQRSFPVILILSSYGTIWNPRFMRLAASKIQLRSSSLLFTLRSYTMFALEF
jgi:hypothetical protein